MKILYAIQGTGNGHISRAIELIPHLQTHGKVDILISSSQWELKLPFEVKYQLTGLGFVFGAKGGIDLLQTYLNLDTKRFLREIRQLPVEKYDLVISDFEPVSAWACRLKNKTCVGLSNQNATLHPLAPRPKKIDLIGRTILERYAPCSDSYGFHYTRLGNNVFTPVIRKEVRDTQATPGKHITVYLPAYDDAYTIKKLQGYRQNTFEIFSKRSKVAYSEDNVRLLPLNNERFIHSMAASSGVITNAGFGTTSEALYYGKKLLTIPMKGQLEQRCNAAFLSGIGISTIPSLKKKHNQTITNWLNLGTPVSMNYPDHAGDIIEQIVSRHAGVQSHTSKSPMQFEELMENLFNPGPALL